MSALSWMVVMMLAGERLLLRAVGGERSGAAGATQRVYESQMVWCARREGKGDGGRRGGRVLGVR